LSFSRRHFLFALLLVILLASAPNVYAQAERVKNVRLWHAPDSTRIVLDVSANVQHSMFTLSDPLRVVVDLNDVDLDAALPELNNDNLHISTIRTGHPNKETLRFVFELKKQLQATSFELTPNELYGHRLVIDLNEKPAIAEQGVTKKTNQASQPTKRDDNVDLLEPQARVQITQEQIKREFIVAIDAGHGGEDPGAIGHRGTHEKQLTLEIAKKLKAVIDKNPNMRAELIRTNDYFIELHKRRMNARNINADIFLSIHADAFTKKSARGFSVFALSQRGATSAMARALAAKENAADLIGGW